MGLLRIARLAAGLFLLAGLAVIWPSCSVAPGPRALIVLGDSISAGCCAPEEQQWPNVLAGRLGAELSNLAQGGAASEDLISEARTWPSGRTQSQLDEAVSLINETDDVAAVTLGIGINDFLRLGGAAVGEPCALCPLLLQVTNDSLRENLDLIVATLTSALSPGTPLLIMTYSWGGCEGGLNGIILSAIRDHEAVLADVCAHFLGRASDFLHADGVHENAAGHAVIADVFTNAVPPDGDADGLSDLMEGVLRTDPVAPDSDGDGCLDGAEFGPDEGKGGHRDPAAFWDFFDTPSPSADRQRDGVVGVGDISAVAGRFGANDAGPGTFDRNSDPLSTPNKVTGDGREDYHAGFDRSPPRPGADPWDAGPPDGTIDRGDIAAAVAQFGHSCA